MKQFKILILIFLFISCSNENHILNIDKNIQVYNYNSLYDGNNILKFEVQYTVIDPNYDDIDNEYFCIDAGYIENGKLTLNYNNIDEKYLNGHMEKYYFIGKYTISNSEAKMLIINPYDIKVYNNENKYIGILRFESYECSLEKFGFAHLDNPCSGIYFIYTTEETKIIGNISDLNLNLNLKKGWNKVYYYENILLLDKIDTTDSRYYPNKAKWKIIMIN
jgi:hypothetical protein